MIEFTKEEVVDLLKAMSWFEGFAVAYGSKIDTVCDELEYPIKLLTEKLTSNNNE